MTETVDCLKPQKYVIFVTKPRQQDPLSPISWTINQANTLGELPLSISFIQIVKGPSRSRMALLPAPDIEKYPTDGTFSGKGGEAVSSIKDFSKVDLQLPQYANLCHLCGGQSR